ncbi:hypothetical protein CAPTEDRAFT_210786 [Capitella teleta]|uniref:DH domain-containing protein n=1 Tax=Capitella teleta TaxID=283909 RepID=R7TF08_CAPTE|nr:hypothetical protein CAPTEDRAFT_210786 [Capitella teleta]|eukprot:ELT92323.1 hypothetical protein CAPTEDRAFT_210786 [Capitella teleta]
MITTQDAREKKSDAMAEEPETQNKPPPGVRASNSSRSRRSRSDLGFKSKSFRSKRTLALLQIPSMRKHVAQSMGLNPDDPCFVEMVTSKLDLAHLSDTKNYEEEINSPPPPPPPPPPPVLIHSKMSASSGDIQMGSLSISRGDRTKSEPDFADMHSSRCRKPRTHIPTFDEFRLRLGRTRCRPASTAFEFLSSKDDSNSCAHSSQHDITPVLPPSFNQQTQCDPLSGANLKSPCEQSVRFIQDQHDELTLDIYDTSAAAAKPSCRKSEEVTSDLEEEFSEISTARSKTCENVSLDAQVSVLRSISDVSDIVAEESRTKVIREKRTKPYKSDPFCTASQNGGDRPPTPPSVTYENTTDGMSKDDVLSFLHQVTHTEVIARSNSMKCLDSSGLPKKFGVDLKYALLIHCYAFKRLITASNAGSRMRCCILSQEQSISEACSIMISLLKINRRINYVKNTLYLGFIHIQMVSSLHEIYDISRSPETGICVMCRHTDVSSAQSFVCEDCRVMSSERRKAIQEIVETEKNFYRSLVTLRDEFYAPLKSSGLLSPDQLSSVFSNLHELVSISKQFRRQLSDSLSLAIKRGDMVNTSFKLAYQSLVRFDRQDYVTVLIGRPFLESSSMLLAFETYCTQQSSAQSLLEQLMDEKNLLRLFLEESLKENEALRRMDLKTFLMVPVQRIMKYPLLLARLLKMTPKSHLDYKAIVKAKSRMEEILEHINMAALEVLGWNRHEAYCLHTAHLHNTVMGDHLWSQRVNSLKFHTAHAVLVSLGRNPHLEAEATRTMTFPHESRVKEVALVLFRDKNGRFLPLRDPISLAQCVVSKELDVPDVFLLSEVNSESFIMKGNDVAETAVWFHLLQLHGKDMGQWRRRRKALPNIMMHHKP